MPDCHHNTFDAKVEVTRITDDDEVTGYLADVRIRCADCGCPMLFLGLPPGLDWNAATKSFDSKAARLPLAPLASVVH
jgi:hypothetical protein